MRPRRAVHLWSLEVAVEVRAEDVRLSPVGCCVRTRLAHPNAGLCRIVVANALLLADPTVGTDDTGPSPRPRHRNCPGPPQQGRINGQQIDPTAPATQHFALADGLF